MMRGKVIALLTLFSAAVACYGAEPVFPTKPIRIIIPTAPGGGSDVMVRMLGQKYTEVWGQQVVVDHRVGAGMTIGINLTAQSAPDGYTMAVVNPSHAINATLMPNLPYDPLRELAALTVLATQPYAVTVTNSLPVKNVKDLIAYAKAKPLELNAANSGPGSASHLAAEMFMSMTGVQVTHVPYKGTGGAMPDLISGRAHFYINPMLAMITQIQAGRIRLIAVTSPKRVSSMPDVPTVAESGVPGYEAASWIGLLAPAATPRPIVERLWEAAHTAMQEPAVKDILLRDGSDIVVSRPEEFRQVIENDYAKYGKLAHLLKGAQ